MSVTERTFKMYYICVFELVCQKLDFFLHTLWWPVTFVNLADTFIQKHLTNEEHHNQFIIRSNNICSTQSQVSNTN